MGIKKKRRRSSVRRKAKKAGFRSGFEQKIAKQLEDDGVAWLYECNKFTYVVPEKQHTYTTDFMIRSSTGIMYIETKGKLTLEDRKKLILVRKQHDIDLRLLFQDANNKLRRGSKTTYGDWATKKGFKWASKHIPKEWLQEMK